MIGKGPGFMAGRPVTPGVIEYCLSNVGEEARRRLRAREDAVEAPCLEHCGICRREPFLVVNGDLLRGDGLEGQAGTAGTDERSK